VWANAVPPLCGVDAAIEAMRGALARYHIEQGFEPVETVIAGNWAFERGVERMTVTPVGGGPPQTMAQRAFLVYAAGRTGSGSTRAA
jgi:ketosteroid isomerase-like protein